MMGGMDELIRIVSDPGVPEGEVYLVPTDPPPTDAEEYEKWLRRFGRITNIARP